MATTETFFHLFFFVIYQSCILLVKNTNQHINWTKKITGKRKRITILKMYLTH